MSARSNAEVDREIWECLFKADGPMLFFSTDYNAANAAWARLTEKQKHTVIADAHLTLVAAAKGSHVAIVEALDATPRQLCDWILAVVEGAER